MLKHMPKTAVCFSGQMRSIALCMESIQNNLLAHTPDYDIFIHTTLDADTEKALWLNPKRILAEKDIDIYEDERWVKHRDTPTIRQCLLQMWSMKQAFLLIDGTYGAIVRMRPDLQVLDPMDDMEFDPNSICMPKRDNYYGYNDRFAFGPTHLMQPYMTRIDAFGEFAQDHPVHTEIFLKWFLDSRGITVSRMNAKFLTIRKNGSFLPPQQQECYGDSMD